MSIGSALHYSMGNLIQRLSLHKANEEACLQIWEIRGKFQHFKTRKLEGTNVRNGPPVQTVISVPNQSVCLLSGSVRAFGPIGAGLVRISGGPVPADSLDSQFWTLN